MKSKITVFIILQFLCCHSLFAAAIIPAPPELNAKSYLVMDFNSGRILAEKNIDEKLPPASLTKIMTSYIAASELAAGQITLDNQVVVSEKAWKMPGSRMFIEVNKKVSVRDLLNGIIIQSGNDASVALAEYISGDETVFAQLMNQQAKKLGMTNSHFTDSTGLPNPQHYTTAHDLAKLARALIMDYPDVYAINSHKEFTYNKIRQRNRNRLLWLDSTVDGVKTGHTEEAGYCLVTSALREGMRLISVVMGAESDNARTSANQALLNYGFRFYETRKLYTADEILTSHRIWKGTAERIALGLDNELFVTIPRGQFDKLENKYVVPDKIIAPVQTGEKVGQLKLVLNDKEIITAPLVAKETVAQAGVFGRIKDEIRLLFNK